jgi:nitrite reductase/ring-hydroxylating ferredoxin subunit
MTVRWIPVDPESLPGPGTSAAVDLEGRTVLLHRVEGRLYATGSVCPHQGRGLAGGRLEGARFTCPWHAWVFDVTTGASPYTPRAAIPCLPVREEGATLAVGFPEPPTS